MNEDILSIIKTEAQKETLVQEIELLMKALFESADELEHVLRVRVRSSVSGIIREEFNNPSLDKEQYLKDLQTEMEKFKSVSLILAFEPSEDTLDGFHSYVRNVIGKYVLLDVVYEPQIIGGAVIIYQGKYRDFSFKKIFEKEFERGRDNFIMMLKKEKESVAV